MKSASKKSAEGLPIFAGGEFDDWFATVFVPFCKRKRLFKCLDAENDPRKVYELGSRVGDSVVYVIASF